MNAPDPSRIDVRHPPIQLAVLVGLGAIGTMLAAKITEREPSALRILADAERIRRYQMDPPAFNGRRLNLVMVSPEQSGPPADLVLVAVKSIALDEVLPTLATVLTEHTQILPLLNGLGAQETLATAFGWKRVLHGFVYCESAMRTGHAVVQDGEAKVVFGEPSNEPPSARVVAVSDFFKGMGIDHHIPADMQTAQWRKWILNVGINQAQALLRQPNRELQQNPKAMRLARDLMNEAAAIAEASGIPGASEIPAWAESVIRAAAPDNRTSMLQDVEAGRAPEVDLFAATVCRLGKTHGIPTPANERALRRLSGT